jgi:hypothetical protein
MGFRVVPVGAVPTATIFASGRIATASNWSVALHLYPGSKVLREGSAVEPTPRFSLRSPRGRPLSERDTDRKERRRSGGLAEGSIIIIRSIQSLAPLTYLWHVTQFMVNCM